MVTIPLWSAAGSLDRGSGCWVVVGNFVRSIDGVVTALHGGLWDH